MFFDWDAVREDSTLLGGTYHMRWAKCELGQSQNGKLMIKSQFEIVAPLEYSGMIHFENFVLGTDENPTSAIPGSMGTRNFKKALKAAQVPPANNLLSLVAGAEGSELLADVVEYVEQQGAYAGTTRNRVTNYSRLGSKVLGVSGKPQAVKTNPISTLSAPSMPTMPTMPSIPNTSNIPITKCPVCGLEIETVLFEGHIQSHMTT